MTATTGVPNLLRALDASSLGDAAAELDTLLRLADNAVDELRMLAACTSEFPGDLCRLLRPRCPAHRGGHRGAARAAPRLGPVTAMTNRHNDSWVQALDAPDRGHAADDLARIMAEVDAMWTRLSRIHDLIARAEDGEVRVHAEYAQDAGWRLQERLDSVVTDLRREEWGWQVRRG